MNKALISTLLGAAVALPAPALAQDRWQDRFIWEVRSDIAEPTRDFHGDSELDTGIGFQASLAYMLTPHFGMYTALDLTGFEMDRSFAGRYVDVVETGYTLGLQLQTPVTSNQSVGFRVRAGLTYNDIELDPDYDRESLARSGHGFGWEVGAALVISLPHNWKLTPGIRYRELGRNLNYQGTVRRVRLEYVNVGVGLSRTF